MALYVPVVGVYSGEFMSIRELSKTCISIIAIALCIASVMQITGQKTISYQDTVTDSAENLNPTLQLSTNPTVDRAPCAAEPTPGGPCTQTVGYWRYNQSHLF